MQNEKIKMENENVKFKIRSPQANTIILHFAFYILHLKLCE